MWKFEEGLSYKRFKIIGLNDQKVHAENTYFLKIYIAHDLVDEESWLTSHYTFFQYSNKEKNHYIVDVWVNDCLCSICYNSNSDQ